MTVLRMIARRTGGLWLALTASAALLAAGCGQRSYYGPPAPVVVVHHYGPGYGGYGYGGGPAVVHVHHYGGYGYGGGHTVVVHHYHHY